MATSAFLQRQSPIWDRTRDAFDARANRTMYALRQEPNVGGGGYIYEWGTWNVTGGFDDIVSSTSTGDLFINWAFARMSEGYFQVSHNTSECLSRYTNVFDDRADLIMIASYDEAVNASIPSNASSVLFRFDSLGARTQFGYAYNWRCGRTNTFDCKQLLFYSASLGTKINPSANNQHRSSAMDLGERSLCY